MKQTECSDVMSFGRCPEIVWRFLRQLGGLNPYGEPNLRLALVSSIMQLRGGEWHDWPKNTNLKDQGGLTFSEKKKIVRTVQPGYAGQKLLVDVEMPEEISVTDQKPMRVVKEMRWVKRYPTMNGWMLQHWDPPHKYGDRAWWEQHKVPGTDFQVLGPFPERGDYEPLIAYVDFSQPGTPVITQTWNEILPFSHMEEDYQRWMQMKDAHAGESANADWRKLNRMIEYQNQEAAREARDTEEMRLRIKDHMAPIFATSLEAGRIREDLNRRRMERGLPSLGHVGN